MKVNVLNTTKRFTSFFTAVIVFVATLCIPAFAVDSYGNEFINNPDYARYTFSSDGTYVTADMVFPVSWNYTSVFGKDWKPKIGEFTGTNFTFDTTESYLCLLLHPLDGRNVGTGPRTGLQVKNGHFLRLDSVPMDTKISYTFSVRISDDVEPSGFRAHRNITYVNGEGKVISYESSPIGYTSEYGTDSILITFSDEFILNSLDFTAGAVGFLPVYSIRDMIYAYGRTTEVTLSKFTLSFPLSSLQYEAQQNEKLQNTMDSVENALEEQGQKMDNILNGTPEQNEQVNGAVGDLNGKADELGSLGDQMASVEKPEINSKDFSADKLVPKTSLVALSAPFHALWENNTLLAMLSIVVALVLVSWIFFGKKG